jgi:hypothetical protein
VELDPKERQMWAAFLAGMRARTPENITLVREMGTRLIKSEVSTGHPEYEKLKEEGDPDTLLEWMESQYPGITENFGLANLPRLFAGTVVPKIMSMAWHPLDFRDGPHALLSSDRPCVFTTGIDDPNCIIALPLSPRHGFIAFYKDSKAQAALMQHGPRVIGDALNKNVVAQAVAALVKSRNRETSSTTRCCGRLHDRFSARAHRPQGSPLRSDPAGRG